MRYYLNAVEMLCGAKMWWHNFLKEILLTASSAHNGTHSDQLEAKVPLTLIAVTNLNDKDV